jgi:hypothetical protein
MCRAALASPAAALPTTGHRRVLGPVPVGSSVLPEGRGPESGTRVLVAAPFFSAGASPEPATASMVSSRLRSKTPSPSTPPLAPSPPPLPPSSSSMADTADCSCFRSSLRRRRHIAHTTQTAQQQQSSTTVPMTMPATAPALIVFAVGVGIPPLLRPGSGSDTIPMSNGDAVACKDRAAERLGDGGAAAGDTVRKAEVL